MNVHGLLACLVGFMVGSSVAAEPWNIETNANLTGSLNTYSKNWNGGEAGSFTWASQFLGTAERQLSPVLNTKTTLKLQFGQTKVQNKDDSWSAPQKSSDLIDAEELFRMTLGSWLDPFASVRAISLFLDGSDPDHIRYFNPWDITEAVGGSRTLTKTEYVEWSARLGAACRQRINRILYDSANSVTGIITEYDSTDITTDGGAEFNMELKAINKGKWATLRSSLNVYEALLSSKADEFKGTDKEDDWRYPHMKWENTLVLTFAKYLMLNISAYAYFDKDISNDVRVKETFSAGVTYIFVSK